MDIQFYVPIINFLSLYLGSNSEIILCDMEQILIIKNPSDNKHYLGAPLDEMLRTLLNYAKNNTLPYHMNYHTFSSNGEKRRSATLFIRNKQELEGLLTINTNISQLSVAQIYINQLINGETPMASLKGVTKEGTVEPLSLSVSEIINGVLDDAIIRFNSPIDRLNAREKLSIIREMSERGVFLAKSSVQEVADKLASSKASIYRYLQQLEKK